MERRHAPGPWVLDPCGDVLGNRNTKDDNGMVCTMCSDRNDEEGVANARLVVAAADLLASLKVVLEMAGEFDDAGPLGASYKSDWWREQLSKAEAAIAKAEGRA